MDSSKVFNGKASFYMSSRPDYAEALLDELYTSYGWSEYTIIADIGSGTGIFAQQMLMRDSYVYCVEPNEDMRNLCQNHLREYSRFSVISGHATHTGLPAESVDCITAAQSFHWFDPVLFREECRRILKPNGKILLVWNMRDNECPVMQASYQVHRTYCPNVSELGKMIKYDDSRIIHFFQNRYEKLEYAHPIKYTRTQFVLRNLSSSYSLHPGDAGFQEYKQEFYKIFEKYASNGIVCVPNTTVAYIGDITEEK